MTVQIWRCKTKEEADNLERALSNFKVKIRREGLFIVYEEWE